MGFLGGTCVLDRVLILAGSLSSASHEARDCKRVMWREVTTENVTSISFKW